VHQLVGLATALFTTVTPVMPASLIFLRSMDAPDGARAHAGVAGENYEVNKRGCSNYFPLFALLAACASGEVTVFVSGEVICAAGAMITPATKKLTVAAKTTDKITPTYESDAVLKQYSKDRAWRCWGTKT
jgi:hypothetical protein